MRRHCGWLSAIAPVEPVDATRKEVENMKARFHLKEIPFLRSLRVSILFRSSVSRLYSTRGNFVSRTCRFEVAGDYPPPYNWLSVRQLDL
uniref:Uncharacterized protein n=1 Tax=Globodera rostochiensis TaxID=31243 RepID=A0A914GZ17_GLORO